MRGVRQSGTRRVRWQVTPPAPAMRSALISLPPEDFYHTILPLAGHIPGRQAYGEGQGLPRSLVPPGHTYMRLLAARLRSQGLAHGRVVLPRPASRQRMALPRSSSDPAYWRLRSARPGDHLSALRRRSTHGAGSGPDPCQRKEREEYMPGKDRYAATAEHKATASR